MAHLQTPSRTEDGTGAASAVEGSEKISKTWYQIPGPRLAGFVGASTGCGALIALTCFLPLPSFFQTHHSTPADALKKTYYIVSITAFSISLICFFGLRNLKDQQHKSWSTLSSPSSTTSKTNQTHHQTLPLPYTHLFYQSLLAGLNPDIALAYIGGFVARASSIGISLFIPLLVNHHFIYTGRCAPTTANPALIKLECREAYLLAAKLTGTSQFIALLLAPAFGYFSDYCNKYTSFHIPLLVAATAGIVGCSALAFFTPSPDPADPRGSNWIYLWVSLLGISQIGAIVCSLGCLSRGITNTSITHNHNHNHYLHHLPPTNQDPTTTPLLHPSPPPTEQKDLTPLSGSIAGTYSLAGGLAILFLTKVGGGLFDGVSVGAPFVILLGFNVALVGAAVGVGLVGGRGRRGRGRGEEMSP